MCSEEPKLIFRLRKLFQGMHVAVINLSSAVKVCWFHHRSSIYLMQDVREKQESEAQTMLFS